MSYPPAKRVGIGDLSACRASPCRTAEPSDDRDDGDDRGGLVRFVPGIDGLDDGQPPELEGKDRQVVTPISVEWLGPVQRILRHVELLRDKVPDWKAYPYSIPAIATLERLEFHPGVTFLVGENGSGKSTLIEAIAIKAGFNPEGGTKNFRSSNRPSESSLHQHLRLARGVVREKSGFFLRAETMFNVSTEAEQYRRYGWDDLHEKSHGEAFLWVALNRFFDRGLYILDEPESALSPQRQLAFLGRMHQLVRRGSQFIVSTHSPILMGYPDAKILLLDRGKIEEVRYQDTDHYAVTKAFLQDPARMLREILVDDEET